MALNYDSISSVVQSDLLPKMVDNITEKSAFLSMMLMDGRTMSAAGRMSQGTRGNLQVLVPLRYQLGTAVGTYSDYDTIDLTPADPRTAAAFDLANYYATISISQTDELKVSGDNAVIQLLTDEMEVAELTLKKRLYQDIFSGSGSNSLVGLDTAIGTGTYGGIAGATYTWWNSTVDATAHTAANMIDSTSTSYILALLRNGYDACSHMGEKPNLILVTQRVFDILEQVADTDVQFTVPTTGRAQKVASLGFNTIVWRNIPIVVDDTINETAHPMYMINTNYLTLYYHPDNNFKFHPFAEPVNQFSRHAKITFSGQLAIENRRMFYRWSDLNN